MLGTTDWARVELGRSHTQGQCSDKSSDKCSDKHDTANMTLSQPLPEEMLVATRVTDCCLGEVARIFIEAIKMLEIPIK